ncbi:MAG: ABC transporter substrate-binding protein, partial [Ilumatobacter sp.]
DDNGVDILAGIEAFGGTVTGVAKGNGPDFAPLVEAALADGADCIASGVSPIEFAALLRAVAGRVPITTVDASVPEGLATSLGSEVDGVHVVSGFLLPGSGHPETVALVEASEELGPDVSLDQFWFSGYVGLQLVAEALEGADESNAAATLAGLTTISGYDSGVGPVIDFSTPNANPALSQLFNPELYLWEIVGGQYQLLQEDTIDMSSAIELVTRG